MIGIRKQQVRWWFAGVYGIVICAFSANASRGGTYINEIFIDAPGSGSAEAPLEYVELRGDMPGMSLANYWLVVVENEGNIDPAFSEVGKIDLAIDLSGLSLGSNGFLVMRRTANSPYTINPQSAVTTLPSTQFENSGGTFMLIDKGASLTTPTIGMKLDGTKDNDNDGSDTDFDGLDYPHHGQPDWTIRDSIGVTTETGEVGLGRMYAPINFGPEADGTVFQPFLGGTFHEADHREPDAVYVSTDYENELIARYGNSTGQTAKDWHVTNVTDNTLAGFTNGHYKQAGGDPHGFPRDPYPNVDAFKSANPNIPNCDDACYLARYNTYLAAYHRTETNQYIPYGTDITNTIGGPNYPLNQSSLPWDYNHDGEVDAADYTVWRDTLGQVDPHPDGEIDSDPLTFPLAANADRSTTVDIADYNAWRYHFGESLSVAGSGGFAGGPSVPEPASCVMAAMAALGAAAIKATPGSRSPAAACPGACT